MAEINSGQYSSNVLILTIDGIARTIEFRTGGGLSIRGVTFTAQAGGLLGAENIYDPVDVEGTATIDADLANWLTTNYMTQSNAPVPVSGTHEQRIFHSNGDKTVFITPFDTITIRNPPTAVLDTRGLAQEMNIAFSLNDINLANLKSSKVEAN